MAVVIEDEAAEEPDLFGLFEEAPYLPAKVTIYRRPLEEEFGSDPSKLEREIRITVLHELAHYFGIDEDRLERAGLPVSSVLDGVGVGAAVLGALVLVFFFLGPSGMRGAERTFSET